MGKRHPFKGYTIAKKYSSKKVAQKDATGLRKKGFDTKIHEGTAGTAWGKKRKVYRLLYKEKWK